MPHHFEFDATHRILLVVVEGVFDDAEQRTINSEIRARADSLGAAAGIGDMAKVTKFDVSAKVLQIVAREPAPYREGTPRFLVAPSDHLYGMSRMYQTVGDESRRSLEIVRSRAEALAALGVAEADVQFERVE